MYKKEVTQIYYNVWSFFQIYLKAREYANANHNDLWAGLAQVVSLSHHFHIILQNKYEDISFLLMRLSH